MADIENLKEEDMRKMVGVVCGVFMAVTVAVNGYAMGGDEAAARLADGNKQFCEDACRPKEIGKDRREELTKGQHPFATVVTCSDSRVSPELLFDQGLGDVFVVRVAGNVLDQAALGSVEYGVEHLHTPLLVIMGHSSCGAVTAALESEGAAEGNIGAILEKIRPAVEKAKATGESDKAALLECAIKQNVKDVYANMLKDSHAVRELVEEGKLSVVLAEYDLASGKVEVLEEVKKAPAEHAGHAGHAAH